MNALLIIAMDSRTKEYDQVNRTTLSLSPSRAPTKFGLEVSLDSVTRGRTAFAVLSLKSNLARLTVTKLAVLVRMVVKDGTPGSGRVRF